MGASKALLPFGPRRCCSASCACWGPSSRRSSSWRRPIRNCRRCRPDVIVTRDEREGRGPLEGLRAGLKALPDGVDGRLRHQLRRAAARARRSSTRMLELAEGYDIAVMEIDGFPHPLSAVYRPRSCRRSRTLLAARSSAAGVPVRCGAHAQGTASRDDRRRSGSADVAQSQYARGLPRGTVAGPAALTMVLGDELVEADPAQ